MQTWTNDKIDRTGWAPGPWDTEPDKAQWKDAETGLDCLMVRNWSGALCGYVGLAPGHALHGKSYNDVNVGVHGGLTFSDECVEADEPCCGICHVVAPGEPDKLWWFGFDCAHSCDKTPHDTVEGQFQRHSGIYRDFAYVQRQCALLARQIMRRTDPVMA